MIFYKNINKKKVGIAVLMSDKVDFKETKCKRSRRALCTDRGILIRTRYNIFFTCMHLIEEYLKIWIY